MGKFPEVEKPAAIEEAAETAIHPFVRAFQNLGQQIGNDIGVLALKALEAQKGGISAVLYWDRENVPEWLLKQMPAGAAENLHNLVIAPPGLDPPPLALSGVRVLMRNLADGSRMFISVMESEPKASPTDETAPTADEKLSATIMNLGADANPSGMPDLTGVNFNGGDDNDDGGPLGVTIALGDRPGS